MNQTVNASVYSPSMSHNIYAQPHLANESAFAPELNTNRTYFATPTGTTPRTGGWRSISPSRACYDCTTRSSSLNTKWQSSSKEKTHYYETRNSSVERYSADDPGLMTQYYGTQQTCYARYIPQSLSHHQETIQQQGNYQSTREWSGLSSKQQLNRPSSHTVYRHPDNTFSDQRGPMQHFREYQSQQKHHLQQQNYTSGEFVLPLLKHCTAFVISTKVYLISRLPKNIRRRPILD